MPKPGKYVVAVSGGVDSIALLDILSRQAGLDLVVAHFDHGIRADSAEDRKFVENLAYIKSIYFVYSTGELGADASEAKAREARYKFLRQVVNDQGARAVITAHHQDDVIETAIINILRGSGRKGLTALKSRGDIIRPLLHVSKKELLEYAKDHKLEWRQDPTNSDTTYLRNYVRHKLLPRFSPADRNQLVSMVIDMEVTNREIDGLLERLVTDKLDRQWFNSLPHGVAREVMAAWLRSAGVRDFDRPALERLVVGAKTAAAGKRIEALKGVKLVVGKDGLALEGLER